MSTIKEVRKETEEARERNKIARENHIAKCAAPFVEMVKSRVMMDAKKGEHVTLVRSSYCFKKRVTSKGIFGLAREREESMLLPGCNEWDTMDGLAKIFANEGYKIDRRVEEMDQVNELMISWTK